MEANQVSMPDRIFDAPIEAVWSAITDIAQMRQWYFPMLESFEARPGFETRFNVFHNEKNFPHHWTVTAAEPPNKLAYEWRFDGYDGMSLAEFFLMPTGNKTLAKFVFTTQEPFDVKTHPELSSENFTQGWHKIMDSLDNHLKNLQ